MGIQVPHHYNGSTLLVDSEMLELDRQVRLGDAVSGWRGDPDMGVCLNQQEVGPDVVEVWGLDSLGRSYMACSTPATDGWRHRLLGKLVKGDWQKRAGDLVEETIANNARINAEREANFRDYVREEFGPKLRRALQKDGLGPSDWFFFPATTKEG